MLKLPEKINTGYVKRIGTHDGRLAFITYWDEKGELRQEHSFNNWRDESIETKGFPNVPTSGLMLVSASGGETSHWNKRSNYCRVYDPRGFEIEITVKNLLYVLENSVSDHNKLSGEFVYAWESSRVVLLPVSADEYSEIKSHNGLVNTITHITGKQLNVGYDYTFKDGTTWVYLGRYTKYETRSYVQSSEENKDLGFYYYFGNPDSNYGYQRFKTRVTLGKSVVKVSKGESVHYSTLSIQLRFDKMFSPIDWSNVKYQPITVEELELERSFHLHNVYSNEKRLYAHRVLGKIIVVGNETNFSCEDFIKEYSPCRRVLYLENGNKFN